MDQHSLQYYLKEKREIQNKILEYLNNSNDIEENYQLLAIFFRDHKIGKETNEFREFLVFLVKLSNNYYRSPSFFSKIERILIDFKDEIQQKFSNTKIFKMFHKNKRIILFLIDEQIIKLDEFIFNIMKNTKYKNFCYLEYFYPELQSFLNIKVKQDIEKSIIELNSNNLDDFRKKRKLGENDEYICNLIRNDLVDEFISYINQKNLPLSSEIQPSIYETNDFLIRNRPTLIQYSAFFGSIQIFKYLFMNGMQKSPSLFIYAIHGENPELIHFLEHHQDKKVPLLYDEFITESIKCHHNEITNYFKSKSTTNTQEKSINICSQSLKYHNYCFFPTDLSNDNIFYYLCKYDYMVPVSILLKSMKININHIMILTKSFNKI